MNLFVKKARASMKGPDIALRGDVLHIVVPAVGISLDSFVTMIRQQFLHNSRHQSISGEFTIADHSAWLRLRLDGQEIYSSKAGGALERPDDVLATAVPELLKKVQPFTVAQSLYRKDPAHALKTAQDIILLLPKADENVINAYVLEAGIYQARQNYAEAVAAAEQAIQIKARYAPAHNILAAILADLRKNDEAMVEYRYYRDRSGCSHGHTPTSVLSSVT